MSEFVTVGSASAIEEGSAKAFEVGGATVAVTRIGGALYAFSDICTHRGCNLSQGGEIDGTTIDCECHGSAFDMTDGSVVSGPATEALAVFGVREEGGDLQVEV
jgi:3-phenylpropionate/trans-cinnamate dioxygenase ferredoxin subunit